MDIQPKSPSELFPPDQEVIFSNEAPSTPWEFIAKHEMNLAESTQMWREVGDELKYFEGDDFVGATSQALASIKDNRAAQECFRRRLIHVKLDDKLIVDSSPYASQKFAQDVMSSTAMALRAYSVIDLATLKPGEFEGMICDLPDVPGIVIRTIQFNETTKLGTVCEKVLKKMKFAEHLAELVLVDLNERITEQPGFLGELETYFKQPHVKRDPLAQELRQMIAVDYNSPDPSKSVLNTIKRGAEQHPIIFREAFLRATADATEGDPRLWRIYNMASYAIKYFGIEDTDEISSEAIMANLRPRVGHAQLDDELNLPFLEFVKEYMISVEKILAKIANSTLVNKVRIHRTVQEVKGLQEKQIFKDYFTPSTNGTSKKPPKRRAENGRPSRSDRDVPTTKDVTGLSANVSPEKSQIQRKLFAAIKDKEAGGIRLVEMTAEQIINNFASYGDEELLKKDLIKIVKKILEPQRMHNSGTKVHNSGPSNSVTHKTIRYPVETFGADRYNSKQTDPKKQLKLGHPKSGEWRVTYARIDGHICIVSVLDHQAFDKEYAGAN